MKDKDLPDNVRALWLKAITPFELRNYGYAISLIQAVLKEAPGFLEAASGSAKSSIATKGKKSFLTGLSTASMKGAGMVKKDPIAAMELAEKTLETDPYNARSTSAQGRRQRRRAFPRSPPSRSRPSSRQPEGYQAMHELGEHYSTMGTPTRR